ncbi:DNA fragmentation factor subunit beta-like [Amphibalanus amphitrite]|uniref:DNA fragmentation factor subunit beta-like n=1 Tax=Amphibalanus amphitrite TaxID=1232801 RepID=UPI001C9271E9|nr:DNA fragmentation factor subunit beta-like [Amphibalanus amphitrite]
METTDGLGMSKTREIDSQKSLKGLKVILFGDKKVLPMGIAARSLGDLINKACARFKISRKGVKICLPDGTQVDTDDYFDTLEKQSMVILLRPGDSLHQAPVVRLVEKLLALSSTQRLREELLEVLRGPDGPLRADPPSPGQPDQSRRSQRTDDPAWFEGLDTGATTKEEYMRRRCESRVRTYFYKSRDQVRGDRSAPLAVLEPLLDEMMQQLKQDRFNGHYFDRSSLLKSGRLCDDEGEFECQGLFSKSQCGYDEHRINPYRSREDRIVFSTWNLDHRIERSRTILPDLVKAARGAGRRRVNWRYFYRLLFTTDNLRLVHIVCHDKGSHDRYQCDQSQVYVR